MRPIGFFAGREFVVSSLPLRTQKEIAKVEPMREDQDRAGNGSCKARQCRPFTANRESHRKWQLLAQSLNSFTSLRVHAAKILPRAHHLEHCYAAQNASIGGARGKVLSGNKQDADEAAVRFFDRMGETQTDAQCSGSDAWVLPTLPMSHKGSEPPNACAATTNVVRL